MSRAIGGSAPLIVVGGVASGTRPPGARPLDANAARPLATPPAVALPGVPVAVNAVATTLPTTSGRRR